MKPIRLLIFALACGVAISCAKNDDDGDPADQLDGTHWQATLVDESPETSPSGANLYYPWPDCRMDDTFIFGNGLFSVDDGSDGCEEGLSGILNGSNQSYSYDAASKLLIIETGDEILPFEVYELNDDRLKLGLSLPYTTGFDRRIFLFKKM